MSNKIILAMIAGNEAAVLPRCVESFAQAIDGLVICWARGASEPDDSEARVREVCDRLKIPVAFTTYTNRPESSDWPHVDDFSAARCQAWGGAVHFAELSGGRVEPGWIMWADADDILPPATVPVIRGVVDDPPASVLFGPYVLDANGGYTRRERLGRVEQYLCWTGRVHERLVWQSTATESYVPELQVYHAPLVTKTGSHTRNLRILESIPEAERTGREWFYLFSECLGKNNIIEAIKAGLIAVERADLEPGERYVTFLRMGKWMRTVEAAERMILEAIRLSPGRREAYAELAHLHLDREDGDPQKALSYALAMRGLPEPWPHPLWHSPAAYSWEAEDLLDLALVAIGNKQKARNRKRDRFREAGRRITVVHTTQNAAQARYLRTEWLARAAVPEGIEWIIGVSPTDDATRKALAPYLPVVGANPERWAASMAGRAEASGRIVITIEDDHHAPQAWDDLLCAALKSDLHASFFAEHSSGIGIYTQKSRVVVTQGTQSKEISVPFARSGAQPWRVPIDTSSLPISVIHPTVRPEQAIRVKELWLSRASHPERLEYIFGTEPGMAPRLAGHDHRVSQPVPEGHASAVVNYNVAAMAATGRIVIAAQDDIEPPAGWDESIAQALAEHLDEPKVLHVHDGHRSGEDKLMVIMCVTRPYLDRQGYLLCPEYDGYWSDTEFSFRAYYAGLVVDGRHIRFFHDHPAFTGAPSDAEYMRQQNPVAAARGEAIFRNRNPHAKW
jgi:hypothetical protein